MGYVWCAYALNQRCRTEQCWCISLGKTVELLACIMAHRPTASDLCAAASCDTATTTTARAPAITSTATSLQKHISCYCRGSGSTQGGKQTRCDDSRDLIQCHQCHTWQHSKCVGMMSADFESLIAQYQCPDCQIDSQQPPLPIKATLIICPPAILQQWRNEIDLHVAADGLKVLLYDGVCGANRTLHGTDSQAISIIRPHHV
jgi:E3 ubiquitin-protein ligase SHPRH